MLLLMHRYGFRVPEQTTIRESDVNLNETKIAVTRLKGGLSSHQHLQDDELKALKAHLRTKKTICFSCLFIFKVTSAADML